MRLEWAKRNAIVLACTLGVFVGCGKNPVEPGPQIPAPGEVVVLAVTGIGPENLVINGDFTEWYAGLNFPAYFDEPLTPEISQTSRALLQDVGGESRRGALQVWHSSDLQEHPESQWGTTVDLAKNQLYTFRTYAKIEGDIIPVVQAWDVNDSSRPRLLSPEIVRIDSGPGPKLFEGSFVTTQGGKTRICSYLTPSSPTEGSVLWYDWHLHRVPGNVTPPKIQLEIVSNTLAQLRGQVAIYGGYEIWKERTKPARDVFRDMLTQLKRAKEDVVTADDGTAIRYNDIRFGRDSGELVLEPGPPRRFRPFWAKIVRANEELRSRGITLICAPILHRMSLYPEYALLDWDDQFPATDGYVYLTQTLLDRNMPTTIILPEFLALKERGQDVYFKNSRILGGIAHSALGNSIAATVRGVYSDLGNVPALSYAIESIALEIPTIDVEESKAKSSGETALPTQNVLSVLGPDGTKLKLDAPSPVLAIGSIAHDYARSSASWPFHASQALGWPIRLYNGNVKDQDILESLLEDHALLSETKIVVFCFLEEKLLF